MRVVVHQNYLEKLALELMMSSCSDVTAIYLKNAVIFDDVIDDLNFVHRFFFDTES